MKYVAIALLKVYKNTLSRVFGKRCIYTPTCSVYSMEAMKQHGFLKGSWLTAKRLARCAPWGKGGFDPVPMKGKPTKWFV